MQNGMCKNKCGSDVVGQIIVYVDGVMCIASTTWVLSAMKTCDGLWEVANLTVAFGKFLKLNPPKLPNAG